MLVAVLAALGCGGSTHQPATATVALGGPKHETVTLDETGLATRAAAPAATDSHLRGEPITAADRNASQSAAERGTTGSDRYPSSQRTLATSEQRGCTTKFVRNFSSRNGARPALFVLHYTVSPNRPGRGDVDGITAFFDDSRAQASSNYVIDNEGNCNYIVAEVAKAWTQGAFNPWSISVEVVNSGREATYAGVAGLAKLGTVVSDSTKRWGIPLQRAVVSASCRVVRPGVIDHDALTCNDHTDIRPYSVDPVIAAAKKARAADAPKPISAHSKVVCRKYAWFGPPGPVSAAKHDAESRRRHGERHRYLVRNHLACSATGVASRR